MTLFPDRKNSLQELDTILEECAVMASRFTNDDTGITDVCRDIRENLKQQQPEVMFYGAYNAGKSTLINSLVGKTVATTGDVPTTKELHRYSWRRITLVDTPGVNATMDDEQQTMHLLKASDLVVFVIREGDVDAADVFDRIQEMLKMGHDIFVIVNYEGEKAQPEFNDLVLTRIMEIADSCGIAVEHAATIPVHYVNAKMAETGIANSVDRLVRASNIIHLRNSFEAWLARNLETSAVVARMANRILNSVLAPLADLADSAGATKMDRDGRALTDKIDYLAKMREAVLGELRRQVENQTSAAYQEILAACQRPDGNQALEHICNRLSSTLSSWLERRIDRCGLEATGNDRATISHIGQRHSDSMPEPDDGRFDGVTDSMIRGGREILRKHGEGMTMKALNAAKKTKMPLVGKASASTLKQWAKNINTTIIIALTVLELFRASKQQENINQTMQKQVFAAIQAANQYMYTLRQELCKFMEATVNDIFTSQIDPVKQAMSRLDREIREIADCRTKLKEMQHRLRAMTSGTDNTI